MNVIELFKKEVFGDEGNKCIQKIEDLIKEKYLTLKTRLIKQYETQFANILTPLV